MVSVYRPNTPLHNLCNHKFFSLLPIEITEDIVRFLFPTKCCQSESSQVKCVCGYMYCDTCSLQCTDCNTQICVNCVSLYEECGLMLHKQVILCTKCVNSGVSAGYECCSQYECNNYVSMPYHICLECIPLKEEKHFN